MLFAVSVEFPHFDDFCGNASVNSTEQYFWEIHKPKYGVATACFLLIYFFVGLPLNFVVAGIMLWKKLYKQPTHILLFSLCLSDSVMLLVVVPQSVVTGFAGEFILGQSDHQRCQACHIGVIITWFALMSLFTIALMSLDRFLFIYIPLRYQRIVTSRKVSVIVTFVWIFCSILSIFPALGLGQIDFTRELSTCTVNFFSKKIYYFIILLMAAVVPLAVLIICNVWVVVIVLKNIKAIYSNPSYYQSGTKEVKGVMKKQRHKKQLHLMQVFGSLILSSLVLWLPVIISTIIFATVSYDDIPTVILAIPYCLMLSQVVVHPILEVTLISAVKEPIKDLLKKVFGQRKENFCSSCAKTYCTHVLKHYDVEEQEVGSNSSVHGRCNTLSMLCVALVPKEFHTTTTECPDET